MSLLSVVSAVCGVIVAREFSRDPFDSIIMDMRLERIYRTNRPAPPQARYGTISLTSPKCSRAHCTSRKVGPSRSVRANWKRRRFVQQLARGIA